MDPASIDPDPSRLARCIGGRYARNAMFVGLGVSLLILLLFGNGNAELPIFLLRKFPVQAVICMVGGPTIAYVMGQWAGRAVLLKGASASVVSLLVGFGSVWLTTFLFSLVGLIQYGGEETSCRAALKSYLVGPIWTITLIGAIPVITISMVMARSFRKKRTHFH